MGSRRAVSEMVLRYFFGHVLFCSYILVAWLDLVRVTICGGEINEKERYNIFKLFLLCAK
jgi:hypothetical protein